MHARIIEYDMQDAYWGHTKQSAYSLSKVFIRSAASAAANRKRLSSSHASTVSNVSLTVWKLMHSLHPAELGSNFSDSCQLNNYCRAQHIVMVKACASH